MKRELEESEAAPEEGDAKRAATGEADGEADEAAAPAPPEPESAAPTETTAVAVPPAETTAAIAPPPQLLAAPMVPPMMVATGSSALDAVLAANPSLIDGPAAMLSTAPTEAEVMFKLELHTDAVVAIFGYDGMTITTIRERTNCRMRLLGPCANPSLRAFEMSGAQDAVLAACGLILAEMQKSCATNPVRSSCPLYPQPAPRGLSTPMLHVASSPHAHRKRPPPCAHLRSSHRPPPSALRLPSRAERMHPRRRRPPVHGQDARPRRRVRLHHWQGRRHHQRDAPDVWGEHQG